MNTCRIPIIAQCSLTRKELVHDGELCLPIGTLLYTSSQNPLIIHMGLSSDLVVISQIWPIITTSLSS